MEKQKPKVMAIKVKDNIYVIHYKPSNRQEKRIAQKEYEKINKQLLPIVYTYLESDEKDDNLRLFAKDEYIRRCRIANEGNTFVTADPRFFDVHFPTQKRINKIIKPKRNAVYGAIIIAIIICYILGVFLYHVLSRNFEFLRF